jgi:hypothetical protein
MGHSSCRPGKPPVDDCYFAAQLLYQANRIEMRRICQSAQVNETRDLAICNGVALRTYKSNVVAGA